MGFDEDAQVTGRDGRRIAKAINIYKAGDWSPKVFIHLKRFHQRFHAGLGYRTAWAVRKPCKEAGCGRSIMMEGGIGRGNG